MGWLLGRQLKSLDAYLFHGRWIRPVLEYLSFEVGTAAVVVNVVLSGTHFLQFVSNL